MHGKHTIFRATGTVQRQHAISNYSHYNGETLVSVIGRGSNFYTCFKRENTSEMEAKITVKVAQSSQI